MATKKTIKRKPQSPSPWYAKCWIESSRWTLHLVKRTFWVSIQSFGAGFAHNPHWHVG
jgi:hypothetical protein